MNTIIKVLIIAVLLIRIAPFVCDFSIVFMEGRRNPGEHIYNRAIGKKLTLHKLAKAIRLLPRNDLARFTVVFEERPYSSIHNEEFASLKEFFQTTEREKFSTSDYAQLIAHARFILF